MAGHELGKFVMKVQFLLVALQSYRRLLAVEQLTKSGWGVAIRPKDYTALYDFSWRKTKIAVWLHGMLAQLGRAGGP